MQLYSTNSQFDVSVVIPARNESKYICRAISSIANQKWPLNRVEVVVVDNGSTDGTSEVASTCTSRFRGINFSLLAEDLRGRGRAKNLGAKFAKGRILIFMDADSYAAPNLISTVMRYVAKGYPAGSIRVKADSDHFIDCLFFDMMEYGKKHFGIRAQMGYFDRELFWRVGGFDESLEIAEDKDLFDRIINLGVPTCHIMETWIATSPRRLHTMPLHLAVVTTFLRWALAHIGFGRRWVY